MACVRVTEADSVIASPCIDFTSLIRRDCLSFLALKSAGFFLPEQFNG